MQLPTGLPTGPVAAFKAIRIALLVLLALILPVQLLGLGVTYYYEETMSRGYAAAGLRMLPGQTDEALLGEPIGPAARAAGIGPGDRILAIGGRSIDRERDIGELGALLGGTGPLTLTLRDAEGGTRDVRIERGPQHAAADGGYWGIGRWGNVLLTFLGAVAMQLSLSGTALMLLIKRWRDPVALLFAATFVAMVAGSDRVAAFFMVFLGEPWHVATTALWLTGLTIGIAAFPDGVFRPRRAAWLAWLAPPAALFLALRLLPNPLNPVLSFALVALALVSQLARFRGAQGIARQQIKWAGLGFGVGVALLAVSQAFNRLLLGGAITGGGYAWAELGAGLAYGLGFAAFPLSLLVAMLRFRLWDVDRVIGRSSAFGIVTLVLGGAWAGIQEVVKIGFTSVQGIDSTSLAAVSTAAVAILFPPLQRRVERWTERKLQEPIAKLRELPELWAAQSQIAASDAIAVRAFHDIAAAVSAAGGDVWLAQDGRWRRLAEAGGGAEFPPLDRDEADPHEGIAYALDARVAQIRLAGRPDGTGYPRDMRRVLDTLAEPLAAALETAIERAHHRQAIEAIHARLEWIEARLEAPN